MLGEREGRGKEREGYHSPTPSPPCTRALPT